MTYTILGSFVVVADRRCDIVDEVGVQLTFLRWYYRQRYDWVLRIS